MISVAGLEEGLQDKPPDQHHAWELLPQSQSGKWGMEAALQRLHSEACTVAGSRDQAAGLLPALLPFLSETQGSCPSRKAQNFQVSNRETALSHFCFQNLYQEHLINRT